MDKVSLKAKLLGAPFFVHKLGKEENRLQGFHF
jgi:hypothetical protein